MPRVPRFRQSWRPWGHAASARRARSHPIALPFSVLPPPRGWRNLMVEGIEMLWQSTGDVRQPEDDERFMCGSTILTTVERKAVIQTSWAHSGEYEADGPRVIMEPAPEGDLESTESLRARFAWPMDEIVRLAEYRAWRKANHEPDPEGLRA